jgi:hypothetical protein
MKKPPPFWRNGLAGNKPLDTQRQLAGASLILVESQSVRNARRGVVTDTPPRPSESHVLNVKWSAKPKLKHAREHVSWCHTIHEHLANLWNFNIMHAVQGAPRICEIWGYEPGQPPRLLQKNSGQFAA